ncbi:MAG: PorV/PorQ family protein [Elusimicrobia bacterium]|nr:PorV/PorQ family protein [Elusimicrobiota bacterium]
MTYTNEARMLMRMNANKILRLCSCIFVYLFVIYSCWGPLRVCAGERNGITGAPVLQIPLGARALAMGGAYTAVGEDLYALNYNPAGLSQITAHELTGMFVKGLDDTRLEFFGYGQPLPLRGLAGEKYPVVAGSLLLSQNGEIEFNQTNPDGSFLSSQKLSAGSDMVLSLGYAERLGETSESYGVSHSMGVVGKMIYSTLAETYHARAFALDAGYLAQLSEFHSSFGLSLHNVGSEIKFIDTADPLPLLLRTGLSHTAFFHDQRLILAANYDYLIHEKNWGLGGGMEYTHDSFLAFRIGYRAHTDLEGVTVGVGIRQGEVSLDYAWGMMNSLEDTHRLTLNYRFGKMEIQERIKIRRRTRDPESDSIPIQEEKKPLSPENQEKRKKEGIPGWIY